MTFLKKITLFLILTFMFPIFLFAAKEKVWQQIPGLVESDFYSVCSDIKKPNIIFVGTDHSVIKIKDRFKEISRSARDEFAQTPKAEQIQEVLSVRGDERQVNYLVCKNFRGRNIIFAATGQGLFASKNEGKSWNKIFEGKSKYERNCRFVDVSLNKIFVATADGLFYSFDNGRPWSKATGDLGNAVVLNVIVDFSNPKILYAASARGVFKSVDEGERWQRIFVSFADDAASEDLDYDDNDSDNIVYNSRVKYITQDPNNPSRLLIASDFGLFETKDAGESFIKFNEQGLFDRKIIQVLISKDAKIYALSKRSIFEYSAGIWHNLYKGLNSEELRNFSQDKEGNLLVAAKQGLFKTKEQTVDTKATMALNKQVLNYFKNEPSIQEIQRIAIKYAEVHPNKIKFWRAQAKVRAFLPELDLAYDKSVYGSSSGVFAVGPKDWGVNFKWDLADLIYNPEQTSIDVRSRLMVQLRDDILNEVTRLYFERRRLQAELLMSPPRDERRNIEKELRLEELTASIDALTGGYLTKALEKKRMAKRRGYDE